MPKILTICPYKLLPPRGGGALRCFHILSQISRYHEVHAIIFQKEKELRNETDGYRVPEALRIYSPLDTPPPRSVFDKLPRRIGPGLHYRWLRRSLRGPADSTLLRCYHLVDKILQDIEIDAVIFEHMSSMTAAPIVNRLSPKTARIIDAHNVDHILFTQEIASPTNKNEGIRRWKKSLRNVQWLEHNLDKYIHSFWACSDYDKKILGSINTIRGFTIPNGVDTEVLPFDENPTKAFSKEIIFCGSLAYSPNVDGIHWFYKRVWPLINEADSDISLTIIGRGGNPETFSMLSSDPRVKFVGEVSEVQPYYQKAGVAIVPLRVGSGTRLKILEAMSLGNPVVSTTIGAEGLKVVNGEHIFIADDPADFTKAIIHLLSDSHAFNQTRTSARKLVETKYDWGFIGRMMNDALISMLENKH